MKCMKYLRSTMPLLQLPHICIFALLKHLLLCVIACSIHECNRKIEPRIHLGIQLSTYTFERI